MAASFFNTQKIVKLGIKNYSLEEESFFVNLYLATRLLNNYENTK